VFEQIYSQIVNALHTALIITDNSRPHALALIAAPDLRPRSQSDQPSVASNFLHWPSAICAFRSVGIVSSEVHTRSCSRACPTAGLIEFQCSGVSRKAAREVWMSAKPIQ
jgi:hypothetical protein